MARAFEFLHRNERPGKPRERGITEVRGPYYDPMGPRELRDLLETMGDYIDIYKFGGGSFALLERDTLQELIEICHSHDVIVNTGGYIETVLLRDPDRIEDYINEAAEVGFDVLEVSSGFLSVDNQDLVAITELVQEYGLKAKPEVSVQFGAGGTSSVEELEEEDQSDTAIVIEEGQAHLDAGAYKIMVEGEGITESVPTLRTDIASDIANGLGPENCVFEAPDDSSTFEWYVKHFGPNVNLFVDSSQIVELEALRSGLWGKKSTWGRVVSYNAGRE